MHRLAIKRVVGVKNIRDVMDALRKNSEITREEIDDIVVDIDGALGVYKLA